MKRLLLILVALIVTTEILSAEGLGMTNDPAVISSEGEAEAEKSPLDISGVIFSHVGDVYEWHLMDTPWGSVALPLPVIVHSKTSGWHCFSSHKLEHGATYEGFRIGESGKVVEATPEGEVRPLDISITKNVLSLILSSILLALLILLSAKWYRKHDVLHEAPKGIAALMEPLVVMVHTMARENIGEENYRKYSPYLCTAFLFILLNNFLGIIPFFPGGANLTGNIAIALVLALFTFFTVNLFGNKHYYKEIFWPDVPGFLKPIMPIIEVMSAIVKPISLTIRLFANMLAGHIMILCMVCIIFIMAKFSPVLFGSMTAISVIFGLFLDLLECLVAFIQAYVFTMLSSIYIGLAHAKE